MSKRLPSFKPPILSAASLLEPEKGIRAVGRDPIAELTKRLFAKNAHVETMAFPAGHGDPTKLTEAVVTTGQPLDHSLHQARASRMVAG